MLAVDFGGHSGLRGVMAPDPDPPDDLIRQLFYLVTAAGEDVATLGAEGQGRDVDEERVSAAALQLRELGTRIAILAEAIEAVLAGNR